MMAMDVIRLMDETFLVGAGKSRIGLRHSVGVESTTQMTFGAAVAGRVFDTADGPSGSTAFAPFRPLGIKSRLICRISSCSSSLNRVISIRRLVTVHFLSPIKGKEKRQILKALDTYVVDHFLFKNQRGLNSC